MRMQEEYLFHWIGSAKLLEIYVIIGFNDLYLSII